MQASTELIESRRAMLAEWSAYRSSRKAVYDRRQAVLQAKRPSLKEAPKREESVELLVKEEKQILDRLDA